VPGVRPKEIGLATLDVLFEGYAEDKVAGTVSLVRDGDLVAVVDPGMVPSRSAILDPLARLGVSPEDVTDVVLSHHHPDHTVNIALFQNARVHDYWAIYENDVWTDRPAEGFVLSEGVRLAETPGHTAQDITTLVEANDGVTALTHLWWDASSEEDPLAEDADALHAGRARVLEVARFVIPGHGPRFQVGPDTPR
jgi:glyoxylase-like metal-dependent hydrolase (beta-lactamase superfamily II)